MSDFSNLTNGTGIEYPPMSIDEALDALRWYRFVDAWFWIGVRAAAKLHVQQALFKAAENISMRYNIHSIIAPKIRV